MTTFKSNGWSSNGLSCLVGILSPIITLIGADSQCHLSEELYNAAYVLPRAMVATATANYIMGFMMVLVSPAVGRNAPKRTSSDLDNRPSCLPSARTWTPSSPPA